jgi:hypothetical protein
VTPTGFFDVVVVVFFFFVAAFFFVASFVGPELSVPMPDGFLEPEVVAAPVFFDVVVVLEDFDFDALPAEVVVAGVVATGVVAAALCEVVLDELSLPQPANTRASRTPVVAVSFRGTAGTMASAGLGMCRT